MPTQWDRFDDAIRRSDVDFDFRDLTFFNFAQALDDSGRSNWTPDAGETVEGELVEPRLTGLRTGPAGIEAEVDAEAWIRDDTIVAEALVTADHVDERPTEFVDETTGKRYQVTEVFDENNGRIRIDAIEL